jgi:tRNA U34 5-methylaminomethyl-2-thiouridine-forming methyltransferase MnmC
MSDAARPDQVIATADGSNTLESGTFGQSYGSRHGAAAEARHVFLQGAGVQARLAAGHAAVVEVGLGTGLNFLLTADAAQGAGAQLTYRAFELQLPPPEALEALAYGGLLKTPGLWKAWLAWAQRQGTDGAALGVTTDTLLAGVTLEVAWGDAWPSHTLSDAAAALLARGPVDAVYQDAFSRQANPALWDDGFLQAVTSVLKPGGCLATYSVAGAVRRALEACGLACEKVPGPAGGKAEMLRACKPHARDACSTPKE